ncbi:MAG: DJ-1/PfpI family protein [Prevotella sp.]|nr:DJ-1/PfpI family protein [Prevotella sp.]
MAKAYVFFADGFEDIEALAPVDILRRGGVAVTTVSINNGREVESAHGVTIMADTTFDEAGDFSDADILMLPGGMPGAANLDMHEGVKDALLRQSEQGKLIGAICAAPFILGHLGVLNGIKATCYPGFEGHLDGAEYTADIVTVDGQFITGRGPGAAMPYGYAILRKMGFGEAADALQEGMIYNQLLKEN